MRAFGPIVSVTCIENDLSAVVLADARELHSHGRPPRPWTERTPAGAREKREWSRQSVIEKAPTEPSGIVDDAVSTM